MVVKHIGADPDKAFGLQSNVNERLRAAVKKNDGRFLVQLEKFLKIPPQKRDQLLGIKNNVITETAHLTLIEEVIDIPELSELFNPQQHFTNNQTIKYWLGKDFKEYLLGCTPAFSALSGMSFSKFQMKSTSYDKDHIMPELDVTETSGKFMTKEEILWTIADLAGKQPNGEKGTLRIDGYATIIGYFVCDDGVARVASMCRGAGQWRCCVGGLDLWRTGREVLSRN